MERRKTLFPILFGLLLAFLGCASAPATGGFPAHPAGTPGAAPVMAQSFASPQIPPGKNWKIYLKARDADGDMEDIAVIVQQPGVGTYPLSLTRIGGKYRKELSGYVYLFIPLRNGLDNVTLTVTVEIRDRSRRASQPVTFPLTIGFLAREEPPPPGVFEENELGPVLIDIRTVREEPHVSPFPLRR